MQDYQWGREEGKREKVQKGTGKKHKWQVKNIQGDVRNIIGNVEAKELICTFHVNELKGVNAGGRGVQGGGKYRGEKKMG